MLVSYATFNSCCTGLTVWIRERKCHENYLLLGGDHFVLWRGYITHWGRVTHICVGKLTIISSGNGLSPVRRQAIIWTNAGLLLIVPLGTNFSEILIEILTFSFKKLHLKVSSVKWRPFCLGLNVLKPRFHNKSTPSHVHKTGQTTVVGHTQFTWHNKKSLRVVPLVCSNRLTATTLLQIIWG